jgi:hypothetical protein
MTLFILAYKFSVQFHGYFQGLHIGLTENEIFGYTYVRRHEEEQKSLERQ